MRRLLEQARRMIRLNSESPQGTEALVNFLVPQLQDAGLMTQVQQVFHSQEGVSKRQYNVIGILGDPLVERKIRRGLLLLTHLDTARPGLSRRWTATGGDPALPYRDE